VKAEVTGADGGNRRGVDVGDRDVGAAVHFQQSARQPAVAGAEFEDLGIRHVADFLEHDSGDRPVQPEQPSHPVEGSDGRALLAFYVVAIDVFRKVGLQLTVEPRRIRAAPWHGLDIQFGRH
jgi:hypothetical protein